MKTGSQVFAMDERWKKHPVDISSRDSSFSSEADETALVHVHRRVTGDNVCILTFDRPGSSANVFDRATLDELNRHLDFIIGAPTLKGLVIASAKDSIFVAGADLHAIAGVSVDELARLIELGQSVFNRLASLAIPTLAAIHGSCVGGGYEMCLACDQRIATPDRATKIGLPETQLGILPAWGGSTRLSRLIGLPKALDVILGGKTLPAKQALKFGMVDDLVPREKLAEYACERILIAGKSLRRPAHKLKRVATNNALVAKVISLRVKSQLLKRTRGHYPALSKALEVVIKGVSRSVEKSLALERDAILELVRTNECRNLVRLFFLQEQAKKRSVMPGAAAAHARPILRTGVIGAGVMGAGIAQWISARGLPVILRDVCPEQVAKGMASIGRLYEEGVRRHTFTRLEARAGVDRIFPAGTEVPLNHVDLVIEAAVEQMPVKKTIFARLGQLAPPDTILATNTSALSVSEIATSVGAPERVVGIHFFNPVHRMQLVEVVMGKRTSTEVAQRALRFVQQMGKLPVLVRDSPGFLVNRILMPYLVEAGYLFEAGASVKDIDECMLDFGMPMGPLRLIDEVGADVARHVVETLSASFGERLRAPQVLDEMCKAGLLGRKSERGFYLHHGRTPEPNSGLSLFQRDGGAKDLAPEELQQRMVLLMVNEAARCLEEQVVNEPDDVDFGMIMATGFAPFRGGPLNHADALGIGKVVDDLERFVQGVGLRFQPCDLLQSMAANSRRFYPEKGVR